MKEIDRATWKRRQHFEFFRSADLPFYNVNVNVDITGLPEFAKSRGYSLNAVLMFLSLKSLNRTENFRYRIRGDQVVLHSTLNPSFAHIKPEDEDLFSLITLDYVDDLQKFDTAVKSAIRNSKTFFDLSMLLGRDDFVFFSSMPWITFTGVDHTLSLKKDDGIPRITWGKFFSETPKVFLPFNIQVNHALVDGIHVAKFFTELQTEIEKTLA